MSRLAVWRRFARHRLAVAGAALLILITLLVIAAPWIAPYDPAAQDWSQRLRPPSRAHPFGTDQFGRDVLSRVLYGEQSWNPLARTVELTEERLRVGRRATPLEELHLAAMAEAFQRGQWLGGGGTERRRTTDSDSRPSATSATLHSST
ncbi:MAG: hypothetical protein LOD84_10585, partial [Limnochordales bacterium]